MTLAATRSPFLLALQAAQQRLSAQKRRPEASQECLALLRTVAAAGGYVDEALGDDMAVILAEACSLGLLETDGGFGFGYTLTKQGRSLLETQSGSGGAD